MNNPGYLYAIAAAVVWGLAYAVNQKVLAGMHPLVFMFIGSLVTLTITLPVLAFQWTSVKHVLASSRPTLLLILAAELLAIAGNFLILSSIKGLGAPLARRKSENRMPTWTDWRKRPSSS